LKEAHVVRAFEGILGNLTKMLHIGAALDFLRQLLPWHQPEIPIFRAALTLLETTATGKSFRVEPLLAFAIRALAVAGLGPGVDTCPGCGKKPLSNQKARFDAARGSIVCVSCGGGTILLSARTRLWMAAAKEESWHTLSPCGSTERGETNQVMAAFLGYHVGPELQRIFQRLASSEHETES
jgi:DNA repair protein RecO (recombination protein O)